MFALSQELAAVEQTLSDIKRRLVTDAQPIVPTASKGGRVPAKAQPTSTPALVSGLKELILPQELVDDFIMQSDRQTAANLETLGILAGVQEGGRLVVKGIVMPSQHGVSDMCECLDDEQLFNELIRRDWMDLGWTHTHPRHPLFLSSVDLHTQACKQQLLPEAIAVVWAPQEQPSLGVFHLTERGMGEVMGCKARGFHPHSSGTFRSAPHVRVTAGLRYSVVNLMR
jgi:proteasome lid subunit RPN8/RPN11